MNMSVFDCKPFNGGLHQGKATGAIETVIEVDMRMFQIDTDGMAEDVIFLFQSYGKYNNMFLLQTITDKVSDYFIGDISAVFDYLIERGVYASNEGYQQRLKRNLLNYFSFKQ